MFRVPIEDALEWLPEDVLRKLESVVLRDESSLSPFELESGYGRKQGLYVRRKAAPHRIELFVDNILGLWPPWFGRLPGVRTRLVYRVFFHELGHHVQELETPLGSHTEDGADARGKALGREYFKDRYPMLVPWAGKSLRRLTRLWDLTSEKLSRAKRSSQRKDE